MRRQPRERARAVRYRRGAPPAARDAPRRRSRLKTPRGNTDTLRALGTRARPSAGGDMDAPDTKSLPANAYVPLAAGEEYRPVVPAERPRAGADAPLGRLGPPSLRHLHGRLGVLGPEGRAGDGGGDPDLDPDDRPRPRLRAALDAARERDRHRDRRRLRLARRGRDLHAARALHPQPPAAPGADRLHLPRRRLPRRAVPDPAAPLLRPRDARPLPVPRGHGDHRGARHGREGRLAGEAAAAGDRHRRRLRLPRHHVPGVARVRRLPVRPRGAGPRRAREGRAELRRRRLHPRPRLRDGAALVADPVRGRLPLELRARAAHLDDRPPPARHARLPRGHPDRGDDGRADLPRLRALRRRRRDRHRRHLRDREVAAHHRRLVLDRGAHVPPRRGRGPGAHRPRHPDRDDPRRRPPLDARRRRLLLDPRPVAARRPRRRRSSRCSSRSSSRPSPRTRSPPPRATRSPA